MVPSVGDLIWPFGNVFAIFLGLRLLNISSICSRDDFNPAKCKARFVLPRPFNAVYWDPIRCFAVFLIVEVFTLIIVKTKAIECILKFFRLVVFSCLYHSWVFSIPDLSDSVVRDLLHISIVKRSDDSVYHLHFVSPSLKLFYICNEAVWFWEQSDLSWKIPPMCWEYSLLLSWR